MSIFRSEKTWRILTNLWTTVFIVFIVFNFFAKNTYEPMILPFSIIYIGVLGLYVGTKEFDRWYDLHKDRHPGEWFVLMWTAVVIGLLGAQVFLGKEYKFSSEAGAVYIMVLSVFALTRKSKQMHAKRQRANGKEPLGEEYPDDEQPPIEGQVASSVSFAGLGPVLREYGKLLRMAVKLKAAKRKARKKSVKKKQEGRTRVA
ncbi:MAG: hypothetical protein HY434_00935 [Candidatus Liptonbacteria bacterium]|nr:hypothetical protein [Candidatus Liptonbacteria bacterium]